MYTDGHIKSQIEAPKKSRPRRSFSDEADDGSGEEYCDNCKQTLVYITSFIAMNPYKAAAKS